MGNEQASITEIPHLLAENLQFEYLTNRALVPDNETVLMCLWLKGISKVGTSQMGALHKLIITITSMKSDGY